MMDIKKTESQRKAKFLVGIGASAGGLEALEKLFATMPNNQEMAYVVVQHLSPDFKSLMDELLARITDLPIRRVEDGMPILSNTIYLLPPKREMIVSGGKLLLTDKDPDQSLTLPIDHFLRSVAQEYGHHAIAVILSGTGSDGSRGIEEIHNAGGLVISQTIESAKFDGMPKSARDTGLVDLSLAPEDIAAALVAYVNNPDVDEVATIFKNKVAVSDSALESLFRLLHNEYSIDFSHYKTSTVSRRTERRLLLNKIPDLDSYVEQLSREPAELSSLYRDLLIGVTQFFRDQEAFEALRSEIRDVIDGKSNGDELRIWIAGCGTGEEAYSVAITVHQELSRTGKKLQVKIFATDVHQDSLNFASHGVYPAERLKDVDVEVREKYFTQTEEGFQVNQEIRQWIVFAPHNVIKDAPFTKLDVICCRNLFIYFEPPAQKKVACLFHFGLVTQGVLFLGPSESLGELSDEFDIVDGHWKIFRKRRDIRLPTDLRLPLASLQRPRRSIPGAVIPAASETSLLGVYDALLTDFIPCAFLVNEQRQLLHTFGAATEFLQPKPGRPSTDLLEMINPVFRTGFSTVFHRANRDNKPVRLQGVTQEDAPDSARFTVAARPIVNERDKSKAILISLEQESETLPQVSPAANPSTHDINIATASSEQVLQLETELRYARENLQAMIEELETSNEELQASNEELVAANEELQSTNEELHSVNEELYTVNSEHQNKIRELTEVTRDLDNLLLSTDVHTIFLDDELCIRKFTPKIAQTFNFLEQDIGRRVDSFTHNIKDENLVKHIEDVLRTQKPMKFEVQDKNDTWFLMRILPYVSGDKVDGVVLTLTDISTVKSANTALQESISRRDEFLAMLSHELRNPLSAILNATYVLDAEQSNEQEKERAYKVIQRQGRQMGALMNDLLDVSRITQKKISLRLDPVDLRSTVEAAVEAVEPILEENDQELKLDIPSTPIIIKGNRSRLQQIQVNLLTNASKYSSPGTEIWLIMKAEKGKAILEVHDDGIGIPLELQDKVFDMFVQSDATIDRSRGGMGLGLTLVRSLVELHHGTVRVSSPGEGRGSRFIVEFPLTSSTRLPEVQKPHITRAAGNRIVVVEDNDDAGQMLQTLLEFDGFEVAFATDGESGLQLILETQPDLAIVDIGLPIMDGYEIARSIRNHPLLSSMHLIALTGYGQQIDQQQALDAGFDEHMVKPLDPELLSQVLNKRLSRPTANH